MDKRYQVFVSSTYADLQEERSQVIQTIMEMDCIPSGMELFPAFDEDQFEFIKKVIDDCDYYLLIIGGRYGTTTPEGISFTEKEYDYAISKGIFVIALVHQDPDSIPAGKTDKDPTLAERLERFKSKVKTGRLVKMWKTAGELPGIVALSLTKAIKLHPGIGWVRGNTTASNSVLNELNELHIRNAKLQATINEFERNDSTAVADIADLDTRFNMIGTYQQSYKSPKRSWISNLTFGEMFAIIGPHLFEHPNDSIARKKLVIGLLYEQGISDTYSVSIDDKCFQTFKIQLQSLGLIELNYSSSTSGSMALFWSLSVKGSKLLTQLRTVRKGDIIVNHKPLFDYPIDNESK